MIPIRVDVTKLAAKLSNVEKRQLPFALTQTINQAAFATREAWGSEMDRVFDRPTAFTRGAVRYEKASKDNLVAQVWLRNKDDTAKGTIPPVAYLQFQARGGVRGPKRSEALMRKEGVLGPSEVTVPARGYPLDGSGNLPGRTVRTILADVQASFDPGMRSTLESRGKRSRRKVIGKRGVFFYWPGDTGAGRNSHKLPRGIYERIRTIEPTGRTTKRGKAIGRVVYALRGVMFPVERATYRPRYRVVELAQKTFGREFAARWRRNLAGAVSTARPEPGA